MFCEKCLKPLEIENSDPVTVSGWYGNTRFEWRQKGGVSLPVPVKIRCFCGQEQKYEEV